MVIYKASGTYFLYFLYRAQSHNPEFVDKYNYYPTELVD
jgi:hypothetical protein